jgi:hypothetical protein
MRIQLYPEVSFDLMDGGVLKQHATYAVRIKKEGTKAKNMYGIASVEDAKVEAEKIVGPIDWSPISFSGVVYGTPA